MDRQNVMVLKIKINACERLLINTKAEKKIEIKSMNFEALLTL